MNHFFARTGRDLSRPNMQQINPLAEKAQSFLQRVGRLSLENRLHLMRKLVDRGYPKRQGDPLIRSHRIDRDRKLRRPAIDRGPLEKQGLATALRFHLAICYFGDLELGRDRLSDSEE